MLGPSGPYDNLKNGSRKCVTTTYPLATTERSVSIMVTSNVTPVVDSRNGCPSGSYLALGGASKILGIHPSTLRRLCDDGQIETVVLPSGHRRLSLKSLRAFQGYDDGCAEGENYGVGSIAVYARVSDVSQNSKGEDGQSSLDRQIERLLSEVSQREKIDREEIRLFKDVASSFGDRNGLNSLVDTIIDGTTKKVYCLYLDRLSRVPALTRLIEHLAEKFGVEIIALDVEDTEGQEVWQKELLNYITVWCNRQSAQKSVMVTRKDVSSECLNRMIGLRRKGWGIRRITDQLAKEGYYGETGVGKKCPLGYEKVRTLLNNGCGEALSKVIVGESVHIDQTIKDFIEQRVRKTDKPEDKLSVRTIFPAYSEYCKTLDMEPRSYTTVGRVLSQTIGRKNCMSNGAAQWRGYKMV